MSNLSKVKLQDVATIQTGKLDSNAAVENGLYPFFTCDPKTLSIDTWAYDTEAVLLAGNNASGNYTAKYYCGKFNAYQRTYIIESKFSDILNTKFLSYAINQQLCLLKSMSAGSTTKFLTMRMLNNLSLFLPSVAYQNRIASILSAYDDLIENNQKQIKLLEEAAQRLYKEWFVDLRFPGWENTKIVDGVPEGWISRKISNLGNVITGKTPSTQNSSFYGKDIPFITIPDMHNFVFPLYTEKKLSNEGANSQPTKYIPAGSLLISCIATVGLTCISCAHCQTNQQINSIIPFQKKYLYYLYEFFSSKKEYLNNIGSSGATMNNVNKSKIENIPVLLPSDNLLNSFHSNVQSIMDKILILQNQFYSLKSMQDTTIKKIFYRGD